MRVTKKGAENTIKPYLFEEDGMRLWLVTYRKHFRHVYEV